MSETQLSAAIAQGQVDSAWMPPFAFVNGGAKGKLTAIVKTSGTAFPFIGASCSSRRMAR